MTHVFISYAKKDGADPAQELHRRLNQVDGLTAWMDISLESGVYWAHIIEGEIDKADLMIVLLTPDVNRVPNPAKKQTLSFVLKEVEYAQAADKPILVAMATSTKVPLLLTGIHYLDLTQDTDNKLDDLVETACKRLGVESPRQRQEREQREAEEKARLEAAAQAEKERLEKLEAERQAEAERRQREAAELAERQRREAEEAAERQAEEERRQREAEEAAALRAQQLAQAQELVTEGDELAQADEWKIALSSYQEAALLIPDDADITSRIQTIQRLLSETDHIQQQLAALKHHTPHQSDQLLPLQAQLLPLLDIFASSRYLNELKADLNRQMQSAYQDTVQAGDQYVTEDNWTEALAAYQKAARLSPTATEITRRIEQLQQVQQETAQLQQMSQKLSGRPRSKIQKLETIQQRLTPLLAILPTSPRLLTLQEAVETQLASLKPRQPAQAAGDADRVRKTAGTARLRTLGIGGGITLLLIAVAVFILPRLNLSSGRSVTVIQLTNTAAISNASAFAAKGVSQDSDWQPVSAFFEGVEMVLVPAGCTPSRKTSITPNICLPAYWIDRYEYTGGSTTETMPRASITFNDASQLCARRGARLPTNAEWEYAALGNDTLYYPWGENFSGAHVVYATTSRAEIGSKPSGASWVGALDMSGNLWEWTQRSGGLSRDAGNFLGTYQVNLRGGSWQDTDQFLLRADVGAYIQESVTKNNVGFRCVQEASTILDVSTATIVSTPSITPTPTTTNRPPLPGAPTWTPTSIPTSTSTIPGNQPTALSTLNGVTLTINAAAGSGVNVRVGPGTNFARLGFAENNQVFPVYAVIGTHPNNWYLIEIFGGTGWVSGDLVLVRNSKNVTIPQVTLTPSGVPASNEQLTADFQTTRKATATRTALPSLTPTP